MDEPRTDYLMLIGGDWTDGQEEPFSLVSPVDGQPWAVLPSASQADVAAAVAAARKAFDTGGWPRTPPARRAQLLRRLGELISERADTIPSSAPDMFVYTVHEPVGVVAAVTPWNSPLALLMWKLCPALAMGNTMVVKPSEVTPASTLVLGEMIEAAGFPPGVVNIVTGDGRVGAWLTADDRIDKIAFTGSTHVGRQIAAAAAAHLTRISLELGGKSPNIVFADADLDRAVEGVVAGIFAAAGQTCLAGSRVLIAQEIYEEFAARLVQRAERIRLGHPLDPDTEMGPLSCRAQYDKVQHYVTVALDEGATLLTGGRHPSGEQFRDGLFMEPTVFGKVRNDMRIAQEEVFGPVVCLIPFTDEDEAIAIGNASMYGLAAGVWTRDIARAHRVCARLRAGTVWINTYRRTSYAVPFGGVRQSGLGRENGAAAVEEYTQVKSVWIDSGSGIADPFNPRA
jgi:(Z)-2-((N-methylformamido)methylene)-5-hydroxybutyrolactone dehydrogenase